MKTYMHNLISKKKAKTIALSTVRNQEISSLSILVLLLVLIIISSTTGMT